jgi:hypothetical protein
MMTLELSCSVLGLLSQTPQTGWLKTTESDEGVSTAMLSPTDLEKTVPSLSPHSVFASDPAVFWLTAANSNL